MILGYLWEEERGEAASQTFQQTHPRTAPEGAHEQHGNKFTASIPLSCFMGKHFIQCPMVPKSYKKLPAYHTILIVHLPWRQPLQQHLLHCHIFYTGSPASRGWGNAIHFNFVSFIQTVSLVTIKWIKESIAHS